MNRLNYIVLITLFLTSCNKQEEQETGQVANAVEVTQDLQVQVLPICPLGTPATRTAATQPEEGEAIRVNYQPDEVTRSDKNTAEKEIKTAYVVQFNGTVATSTAVWVSGNVATQLKTGNPISCSFSLSSSTESRVYVVANPKTTPTKGMTLQAFEVVPYTVSTSLPPTGLPMAAYQDVLAGSTFSLFQLKSPLAKLKFTCANGTLTLKGVPSAYSCAILPSGAGAVRPSGVTYAATVALTSGTTYYIPANLSGTVSDLSSSIYRYSGKAPANSMYVDIDTDDAVYSVYLGDGSVSDFNVAPNYAYTVTATLLGDDPSDLRVKVKEITNLSANGTANCYIVTSADTYRFDATVMGNGKTVPAHTQSSIKDDKDFPAITPTKLSPVSVEVLWETLNTTTAPAVGAIVSNVKLNSRKDRITFESGTTQGNAVIAVKNSSGTILWSWHIWRVNEQPREFPLAAIGSVTTDGELVLMDRNLGALSATAQDNLSTGLYYQWGRKDPFPGGANLSSETTTMATAPKEFMIVQRLEMYSVAQSIQQPTTFIVYSYDWCSTRTDNLWGTPLTGSMSIKGTNYNTNKGMKSIYDPCPPGWRVPPAHAFANVAKGSLAFNKGYSFPIGQSGAPGWFPATGEASNGTAKPDGVGARGVYWTSTPYVVSPVTNGARMYLREYNTLSSYGTSRNSGISCRCCKE